MKSLDNIAEDLFNKIRGRFPSVTIGDENGKITNDPLTARFFDFDYKEGDRNVGKVSVSVSEDKIAVMYSNSFVENEDTLTRQNWYNFLKELRTFAKKRLLQFDTRDITKSNLDKRDYKFLAQQNGGEQTMSESKMYGTSKISYQDIGNARLSIKHTQSVNQELAAGRTQKIGAIYVENAEGERFKYPFKHLNGARAMARHVSEGGMPYDDFGKHVVGLSEELSKLRKFKSYMGRSSVMAESLSDYLDVVAERISTVKKTIQNLQKENYYKETVESFETPVMEDVPSDVAENWIDQLTIKQFNEELADVFPYIYKLVSEASKAEEISPEDLEEGPIDWITDKVKGIRDKNKAENAKKQALETALEKAIALGAGDKTVVGKVYAKCLGDELGCLYSYAVAQGYTTPEIDALAQELEVDSDYNMKGIKNSSESEIENSFEEMMGQFSEGESEAVEAEEQKTPLGEFILSYFDRHAGQFPKGETAVLTMVEKDYGEEFINPAKQFIEMINNKVAEMMGYKEDPEVVVQDDSELNSIRSLAGI